MNLPDQLESYMVGLHQDLAIEVEKKDPKSLLEAMEFAQRIELMTSWSSSSVWSSTAMHHFSRSSSSQHRDDPMEISAIHQSKMRMISSTVPNIYHRRLTRRSPTPSNMFSD